MITTLINTNSRNQHGSVSFPPPSPTLSFFFELEEKVLIQQNDPQFQKEKTIFYSYILLFIFSEQR